MSTKYATQKGFLIALMRNLFVHLIAYIFLGRNYVLYFCTCFHPQRLRDFHVICSVLVHVSTSLSTTESLTHLVCQFWRFAWHQALELDIKQLYVSNIWKKAEDFAVNQIYLISGHYEKVSWPIMLSNFHNSMHSR